MCFRYECFACVFCVYSIYHFYCKYILWDRHFFCELGCCLPHRTFHWESECSSSQRIITLCISCQCSNTPDYNWIYPIVCQNALIKTNLVLCRWTVNVCGECKIHSTFCCALYLIRWWDTVKDLYLYSTYTVYDYTVPVIWPNGRS